MTVELFDPTRDYSQSRGNLVYKGGPLLNKCKLYGVYFFDGGNTFPYMAEMSKFLDWYGTSDLIAELSEYKILGPASHPADFILSLSGSTPVLVPTPPPPVPIPNPGPPPPVPVPNPGPPPSPVPHHRCPPGCRSVHHRHTRDILRTLEIKYRLQQARSTAGMTVTDGDLQKLFTDAIAAGNLPKPDTSTLYVSFLPSGVVVDLGSDASCQSFCGYHSNTPLQSGMQVYYAVLPYPDCAGCTGGLSPFDALTSTTSHEISEALTDAVPGTGWFDDQNAEIGDLCAWQTRKDGPYVVQLEWSNTQGRCV